LHICENYLIYLDKKIERRQLCDATAFVVDKNIYIGLYLKGNLDKQNSAIIEKSVTQGKSLSSFKNEINKISTKINTKK
jgi:hypothetical protein